MRRGHAEVRQQKGRGLRLHRGTAVRVQRELAGQDVMLGHRIVEQRCELRRALGIGDAPADDAAAEDVKDDIEIVVAPLGRTHQFGDNP